MSHATTIPITQRPAQRIITYAVDVKFEIVDTCIVSNCKIFIVQSKHLQFTKLN